jgi:general secretion pathway protein E/type IV pilus assembly protein PilB
VTTAADELVLRLAQRRGLLRADEVIAAQAVIMASGNLGTPAPGLLEALVGQGTWDEQRSAQVLADEFRMKAVELKDLTIAESVLALVPREFAMRHRLMPFALEGSILSIAVSDPLETDGVDSLAHQLDLTIELFVAPVEAITDAIEAAYGGGEGSLDTLLDDLARGDEAVDHDRMKALTPDAASDAPIIKLVQSLIIEAIQRRASDIHLEPLEQRFRVRYRIDGVLIEAESPPKRLQLAIISRLKIMANISIAQKRLPGDGRIQMVVGDRTLDLRVSSLPTVHGESIVMRILDKASLQLGLPELGFLPDDEASFQKLITLPDGIVLVTGPTGSGKTTTLYGCLHHINKSDRKIITVEDPIEYQLTGINQVPVRHEVGMTFASALRAMLRQAPNIVMIGEIRDRETAEIAINAALTGHMVFSTLHTNDAPGAVTRLIDIGVKPFLVSTALRAAMAQRLVRKICQKCQRPTAPDPAKMRLLNLEAANLAGAHFMEGAGCEACNGTGFRGRMGIFEMFEVNEELQRMIYENTRSAYLRERARSLGMRTMREDGLRKATAGLTTVEEVVSITVGEAS